MEKIVVDLEVKSNKGVKEVEKLNKELNETKEVSSELGGTLDKATGGAVSKFKGLWNTLKIGVKSFNSLRVAIIGTGIGALLIAVTSLSQAFTRSEEGQNKFSKILGIIGSVTGNLLDLFADLGESIISVFENPKQALIDFKNLIVTNIQNRFKAILDTVGFLGSAFKKVFSGDFSGALDDAKKAGNSFVDTLTGVEDTLGKVTKATSNFVTELKEEAKIAGQIADQRAKADKVERKLIVERAKANRDRADLLEKAVDKEKFTIQQRIEFLKQAGELEQEITNKEIAAAQLRLKAKQAENALTKSTKADLDEEINLKARLIDLETQRLTKQKEVTGQIIALNNEEKARIKADEDANKAKQKEEDDAKVAKDKELADLKKQIRDAEAVTEDERRALEIEKTTEHYRLLIEQAKAQGLSTVALEEAKTKALDKLNQTTSKNEVYWAKLTQQEKVRVVSQGLNNLSTILGEESAAGKAAAIASATISTYQSATDSYKSLAGIPIIGPALGFAAAGVAVTAGFANIKKIVSTKTPGGKGGGSAPSISASQPSAPSIPPAFNVVGASSTNQLAEAIGGKSKEPVKAYVVSNDVTTAQSLDRNIVNSASI